MTKKTLRYLSAATLAVAATSGFARLLPSTLTGPRLLKLAMVSPAVFCVAPTLKLSS